MKALVFLCKKSWVLREKYAKKLAAQPVQNEYESEDESNPISFLDRLDKIDDCSEDTSQYEESDED